MAMTPKQRAFYDRLYDEVGTDAKTKSQLMEIQDRPNYIGLICEEEIDARERMDALMATYPSPAAFGEALRAALKESKHV